MHYFAYPVSRLRIEETRTINEETEVLILSMVIFFCLFFSHWLYRCVIIHNSWRPDNLVEIISRLWRWWKLFSLPVVDIDVLLVVFLWLNYLWSVPIFRSCYSTFSIFSWCYGTVKCLHQRRCKQGFFTHCSWKLWWSLLFLGCTVFSYVHGVAARRIKWKRIVHCAFSLESNGDTGF